MALQMHRFTPDVTLVTNDGALGLTPEAADRLARRELPVVVGRIASGRSRDGEPGMLASSSWRTAGAPGRHLSATRGPRRRRRWRVRWEWSGAGAATSQSIPSSGPASRSFSGRGLHSAVGPPDRDGGARGRDGGADAQLRPVRGGRFAGGDRRDGRLTGARQGHHPCPRIGRRDGLEAAVITHATTSPCPTSAATAPRPRRCRPGPPGR